MNGPKHPSDDQDPAANAAPARAADPDAVAPGTDSAPDVVEVDETGAEKPIRGLDISDCP